MNTPTTGNLLVILDGQSELQFERIETGHTVTPDDAARDGFFVPPQHSVVVIEALLRLAKIKEALA